MVFYLIPNLFCFKFITRHQFVLKYLSVTISINIYICNIGFFKFSSPRNIILICPKLKILKHINKEIDSSLVAEEYIPFLSKGKVHKGVKSALSPKCAKMQYVFKWPFSWRKSKTLLT